MGTLAAAPVWHFWIGVALAVPAILLTIGVGIGYLVKVVSPRYPKQ